jgi:hypothetical protein
MYRGASERVDPPGHRCSNGLYLVDGIRIACLGRSTRNKGVWGSEAKGSKAVLAGIWI